MNKNRVITILLSYLMIFVFIAGFHIDICAVEEQTDTCRMIVNAVTEKNICELSDETSISRGETVNALVRFFALENVQTTGKVYFADVSEESPYFQAVSLALEYGWISPGSRFEPDRNITGDELVKIFVSAMGYGYAANYTGGYPIGYRTVAKQLDLYNCIENFDGEVQTGVFYGLLYHALEARIADAEYEKLSQGTIEANYYMSEKTVLEALYKVHTTKGIVTATSQASIYGNEAIIDNDFFEIDGNEYQYTNQKAANLGKYCQIYYKEKDGKKQILALEEKENRELEIAAEDISAIEDTNALYYDENGRQKNIRLEDGYILIYNGRYADRAEGVSIENEIGSYRFLDNDSDGKYDIVFQDMYTYFYVGSIDVEKQLIADENQNVVSFQTKDPAYGLFITEMDGTALEAWQIKSGDVVAVQRALDGTLCKMVRCSTVINGSVTEIKDQETICINDEEYKLSQYALESCGGTVLLGAEYKGYIGLNGEIAYLYAKAGRYKYGYLVNYSDSGDFAHTVQLKIFSEDGKMEVLNSADKVSVDANEKKMTSSALCDMLHTSFAPSLIKYKTNGDGEIIEIDFPKTRKAFVEDTTQKDSLTELDYGTNTFTYKTSQIGCPPYFNFAGTVIFGIPEDSMDDEDFCIFSTGDFGNDEALSGHIYDVDQYASAGVAVLNTSTKELGSKYDNLIIGQVYRKMNNEGEIGTGLECYGGYGINEFVELFVPDDVAVKKPNGRMLQPGDIIRAKTDKDNTVLALEVDFEILGGQPTKNSVSTAPNSVFGGGNSAYTYQWGMIYSVGNGYMTIAPDSDGSYGFEEATLHNFIMTSGAAIVCFDMTTQQLAPVSEEEINTYISYGTKADMVVIRQANYASRSIFIYRQ